MVRPMGLVSDSEQAHFLKDYNEQHGKALELLPQDVQVRSPQSSHSPDFSVLRFLSINTLMLLYRTEDLPAHHQVGSYTTSPVATTW